MAMTEEDKGFITESEGFVPENMLMDELLPEYEPEMGTSQVVVKVTEPEAPAEAVEETTGEVDETPVVEPEKIPEWEEVKKRLEKAEELAKKAEARAGYWQRQAEKAKETPKPAEPQQKAPEVPELEAPKEEDFDTERDYLMALADHRAELKIQQWEARNAAKTVQQTEEQRHNEFKRKLVTEGPAMFTDFAEAVSDPILPITDGILNILKETEVPVELTYYLAKNANECAAISRMTPVAAARAIGKIEAQIVADKQQLKEAGSDHPAAEEKPKPKEPTKPISQAPAPITPIRSKSAPTTKDPDKMTHEEYRQWRVAGGK